MNAIPETIFEECSAIVFYGIEPSAMAAAHFYSTVVEWFKSLGYPPDRMGIEGPGNSGKLGAFARGDSKLRKSGFEGVVYCELISSTPDARTGHDYFLTAIYNGTVPRVYAILVARSSLAELSSTSMLPIVQTLAQVLTPAYGIGYRRKHGFGPELYAVGICYGGDDVPTSEAYEEDLNISRWGDLGMVKQVYREGLLRDVYPWNFLTEPQLARPVVSESLKQWIGQDSSRGRLSPVAKNVMLWEVEETRIPDLRRTLHEAGAIFDWRIHS